MQNGKNSSKNEWFTAIDANSETQKTVPTPLAGVPAHE